MSDMTETTPGWLSPDDLELARARMPILYVEAVPVRVDDSGEVTSVGLLLLQCLQVACPLRFTPSTPWLLRTTWASTSSNRKTSDNLTCMPGQILVCTRSSKCSNLPTRHTLRWRSSRWVTTWYLEENC